jgi:hypothetical protein
MDETSKRIAVHTTISRAMARDLWNHTVAFMDMGTDEKDVASGVLVRIKDHLFVATAADVIPKRPPHNRYGGCSCQ